ncbi:MAG: sigma-70 family RNA polymerase sigma factor [Tannerellaceae bacterium]|jgi:RNA polymerase sigma-70 factor (ECF subfamily)|nr:sigma-70 family RNA polymerase sigma factor [Tannerellaceae bacterium]
MTENMLPAKEAAIWNQFRKGDKEAFAALFEWTSDRLFRYGMKFTNNKELVKDSIQDVFLKLYQNRGELPEMNNPVFYLFKILKNTLIDALRQKEKMVYLSPQELPFHVEFVFEPEEDAYNDDNIKVRFEKAITLLSNRQKEAIYLRFQAELSYEEISQLLGINYQSARNLIHRAIEKIRDEMDFALFITFFLSALK